MANAAELVLANPAKILCTGNNGSGKTGSLLSLLIAGYKVRLLDLDNGAELLLNLIKARPDKDKLLALLDIETHQDEYDGSTGVVKPKLPLKGFSGAMKTLSNWPGLGKPTDWGLDTVLAMDSLTMLGNYCMNHVLSLAGRLPPAIRQQQDWGQAMDLQESVCAMLFSDSIKCHVIVMSHITYIQPEGEPASQGFPSALGAKLPPKIGSYFNSTLYYGKTGVGPAAKRSIITGYAGPGKPETKTSAPGLVKPTYPIETGLADYLKDLGHTLRG